MEIKLTNGDRAKLNLKDNRFNRDSESKSIFQKRIGLELIQKYPYDLIFQEVYIPVENLVLDFFIPSLQLVIECQGRQHEHHTQFFHPTKKDFHNQQDRDRRKREWCLINNFKLIEIPYES